MRMLSDIRKNQAALGVVLLVQTLIILLAAHPNNPSPTYEAHRFYFLSFGILDEANDRNFASVARVAGADIASRLVMYRIYITNLVLLFTLTNLFFFPFYWDFMIGRYFRGKDPRMHLIFFALLWFLGLALFFIVNVSGDYFHVASAPPVVASFPLGDRWWVEYALMQSVLVFWSGLVFSVIVLAGKSLIGSLGTYGHDFDA
jgi:hypothetical protein